MDIEDTFERVSTRGVGSEGSPKEPCHSPLAYLSVEMDRVMAEVRATRAKRQDRDSREAALAAEKFQEQQNADREAAEWAEKERAFCATYPTREQAAAITRLCTEFRFRRAEAARRIAVGGGARRD